MITYGEHGSIFGGIQHFVKEYWHIYLITSRFHCACLSNNLRSRLNCCFVLHAGYSVESKHWNSSIRGTLKGETEGQKEYGSCFTRLRTKAPPQTWQRGKKRGVCENKRRSCSTGTVWYWHWRGLKQFFTWLPTSLIPTVVLLLIPRQPRETWSQNSDPCKSAAIKITCNVLKIFCLYKIWHPNCFVLLRNASNPKASCCSKMFLFVKPKRTTWPWWEQFSALNGAKRQNLTIIAQLWPQTSGNQMRLAKGFELRSNLKTLSWTSLVKGRILILAKTMLNSAHNHTFVGEPNFLPR